MEYESGEEIAVLGWGHHYSYDGLMTWLVSDEKSQGPGRLHVAHGRSLLLTDESCCGVRRSTKEAVLAAAPQI